MSSEQLNAILYITYLTGLAASQSLSHYRKKRGLMELLSGAVVTFCRRRVVWNCNCQPRFLRVHLLLPLQRCPFNNYPNTLSCDGFPKQRCNHYRREVPTALPKLLLFIDIYIYIYSFIFKYIHTYICKLVYTLSVSSLSQCLCDIYDYFSWYRSFTASRAIVNKNTITYGGKVLIIHLFIMISVTFWDSPNDTQM